MKPLQLQRYFSISSFQCRIFFSNILIKYCCSGGGWPPRPASHNILAFVHPLHRTNTVWKPLLCETRKSIWCIALVPTGPTRVLCTQPALNPRECSSEREHPSPVATAWASVSCLDRPPKDNSSSGLSAPEGRRLPTWEAQVTARLCLKQTLRRLAWGAVAGAGRRGHP